MSFPIQLSKHLKMDTFLEALKDNYLRKDFLARRWEDEGECIGYLRIVRWQKGTVCLRCGHDKCGITITKPGLIICHRCWWKFSVRRETMFQNSRLPLTTWFTVIRFCLIENKVTSTAMAKALGTTPSSAWKILNKLREAGMFDLRRIARGV